MSYLLGNLIINLGLVTIFTGAGFAVIRYFNGGKF